MSKENNTEVKFTTDEMKKLTKIKNNYMEIQYQFGQSAMSKLRLEEQISTLNTQVDSLKNEYRTNQETEREFLKTVNDKYGEGQLDPETGVFVKIK